MKSLLILALTFLAVVSAEALEPTRLVKAEPNHWLYPVYSPDDLSIAFSVMDFSEIWSLDLVTGREPSRTAKGDSIGRRFVFEPGLQDDRVVYRVRIQAHPDKPVRLISTSIHLFDPAPRSANTGDILGPYAIAGQLWYRRALNEPLIDVKGNEHPAGAYWDKATQSLWVQDSAGARLYTSPAAEPVEGFEISPDGKWAAAVTAVSPPLLYLVSLSDGTRYDLGSARWPSWSGNSKYLACLTEIREDTIIRIYDIATRVPSALELPSKFNPEYPALNSDGSKLLFVDGGAIYQVDVGK
jgi:hypothetical protein